MADAEKSKSTKASKIKAAGKPGEEKSPAKAAAFILEALVLFDFYASAMA